TSTSYPACRRSCRSTSRTVIESSTTSTRLRRDGPGGGASQRRSAPVWMKWSIDRTRSSTSTTSTGLPSSRTAAAATSGTFPSRGPRHPQQPVDPGVREGVGFAPDLDHDRPDDRQGDRQVQGERRPGPGGAGDPDAAADFASGVLDDVQPDPAAGDLGDGRGG